MPSAAKSFYDENGYYVARSVFGQQEAADIRDHFMEMRKEGPKPGDYGGDANKGDGDPLNKFPRFINMHKSEPDSGPLSPLLHRALFRCAHAGTGPGQRDDDGFAEGVNTGTSWQSRRTSAMVVSEKPRE